MRERGQSSQSPIKPPSLPLANEHGRVSYEPEFYKPARFPADVHERGSGEVQTVFLKRDEIRGIAGRDAGTAAESHSGDLAIGQGP